MADPNVIRTITVRSKTEGVDESTGKLDKLAESQDNVAASGKRMAEVSETSARQQLSNAKSIEALERRFVSGAREAQTFAKVTEQVNRISAQSPELHGRAAAILATFTQNANEAARGSNVFGAALKAANDNAAHFAHELGPVGPILTAIGPAGLAAAAALGVLAFGFKEAADAALKLAEDAGKLVDTADTIGITVEQLRALQLVGGDVGVDSEKLTTGLEKFATVLGNVRAGAQGATDSFDKLSPGLADNVRNAKTMDEALQLVFQGLKNADTAAAALGARELFGKGGTGFVRIAGAVTDVTKLADEVNRLDVITGAQAKTWDQLGDSINKNMKLASTNVTASFAEPVLRVLNDVSKIVVELSRTFRLLVTPIAEGFATDRLQDFRAELQTLNVMIQKFGAAAAVTTLSERLFGENFVDQVKMVATQLAAIAEILNQINIIATATAAALRALATADFAGLAAALTRSQAGFDAIGGAVKTLFNAEFGAKVDTFAGRFDAVTGAVKGNTASVWDSTKGWIKYFNLQEDIGNITTGSTIPNFGKAGGAAGDAAKKALDFVDILRNNVSALGDAATAAEKYQLGLAELAKKLQEGTINQDTFNRAVSQLPPTVKAVKEVVTGVGDALAGAFIRGASAADALKSSLQAVASTASSKVINQLFIGATSGTFDLPTIATQGLIGAGAGLLSKLFGGGNDQAAKQQEEAAKRAAEELQKAKEAWAAMTAEVAKFNREAAGLATGKLTTSILAITDTAEKLMKAANAAHDFAGEAAVGATAMQGVGRLLREFATDLPGLIGEFGATGPLADARSSVKSLMDNFKDLNASIQEFASRTLSDQTQAFIDLNAAARSAVMAMLDVPTKLSETGQQLVDFQAKAVAMQEALVQLGVSAEDAAAAVNDKLNVAIDKLRGGFLDELTRQVNALAGGEWINQAQDLAAKVAQMRADAAALGVQTALIDTFFVLSAQKIVDQNQLVGAQFDALAQTLGLSGTSLHAFQQAVDDVGVAAARSAAVIASTIQSLQDQLFVAQQDQSTLAGKLAVFDLDAQRRREDEIAKGGQALAALDALIAQQRLNIINDFYQQQLTAQAAAQKAQLDAERKAAEERQRILEEAQKFLEGALRNIQDFISHFLSGQQSFLSPLQRLQAAQSTFTTQYAQALGGSREALSGITSVAQDLIESSRAYYGSSTAGQTIVQQTIGQLQALPSMVSAEQFIVDNLTTATQDQTTALQTSLSALQAAINSGSASAIASALLPLFDTLDTTMDSALSYAEFQAGLTGMASDTALQSLFKTLDVDNSGSLTKLELIRAATATLPAIQTDTGNTVANTGSTVTAVNAGNALLNAANSLATSANNLAGAANNLTATGNATLVAIQTLIAAVNQSTLFLSTIDQSTARIPFVEQFVSELPTIRGNTSVIAAWAPGSNHELGGLLQGPRHAQGGVPLGNGHYAEGGEYIMSRATTARVGVGALDAVNFGGGSTPANDNMFTLMRGFERNFMRGIAALIETQLQVAGMIAAPMQEANKLQRTRRGEKKAA